MIGYLTGKTLLRRMACVHAGCQSFEAAGQAQSLFFKNNGWQHMTRHTEFHLTFERPNRLRYSFNEHFSGGGECEDESAMGQRRLLWSDGQRTFEQREYKVGDRGVEEWEHDTLAGALPGFAATDPFHTLIRMLLPDTGSGLQLTDLHKLHRLRSQPIDGVACYLVQGRIEHSRERFWFGRDDLLLRKLDEHTLIPGGWVQTATMMQPKMNEPVDIGVFESAVPEASATASAPEPPRRTRRR